MHIDSLHSISSSVRTDNACVSRSSHLCSRTVAVTLTMFKIAPSASAACCVVRAAACTLGPAERSYACMFRYKGGLERFTYLAARKSSLRIDPGVSIVVVQNMSSSLRQRTLLDDLEHCVNSDGEAGDAK